LWWVPVGISIACLSGWWRREVCRIIVGRRCIAGIWWWREVVVRRIVVLWWVASSSRIGRRWGGGITLIVVTFVRSVFGLVA